MEINSIQHVTAANLCNNRVLWSKKENIELYRCYCLAKLKSLPIKSGTFELWRQRNPTLRPRMNASALFVQKGIIEHLLTSADKQQILKESEDKIKLQNSTNNEPCTKRQKVLWSKKEEIELYRCYCLARLKSLPIKCGAFKLWRERNPMLRPTMSAAALYNRKRMIEDLVTSTEKKSKF